MMTRTLSVSEIFGPTIQGEGVSAGERAVFLRLGGCNLSCSWCDTPYTWDWSTYNPREQLTSRTVIDVATTVEERLAMSGGVSLLVVTGGEPLLQALALSPLLYHLTDRNPNLRVEIETNGTRAPVFELPACVTYNVSPKLAHAQTGELRMDIVREFVRSGSSNLKFVVDSPADILEVERIVAELRDIDPLVGERVWVMPQARSTRELDDKLAWIAERAIERGWNVTDRLQIRIWGDERGH